jgi:hypothetical protein
MRAVLIAFVAGVAAVPYHHFDGQAASHSVERSSVEVNGTEKRQKLHFVRDFGGSSLFRDAAYGSAVVLGGKSEDVFRAVGYAHASDRLFQIWLRIITANGRLAEFFGAGASRKNVESDVLNLQRSYTDAEMTSQLGALSADAQAMHRAFAVGMQTRVDEVNAAPSANLPWEFQQLGLSAVPTDVFELIPVLHYTLVLFRGLCSGYYPSTQLDSLADLALMTSQLGDADKAWGAFGDIATELGDFELTDTVIGKGGGQSHRRTAAYGLPTESQLELARAANNVTASVQAHLQVRDYIMAHGLSSKNSA